MTDRLVGYIRVSSKAGREDDRFLSPDLQRTEMERWAERRYEQPEWIAWHVEIDRTGMTQARPVLTDALADAERAAAALVVFALSRWARNVEGGLRDMDRMRDAGVRIESASEPVEMESAIGRFGVQILLAVAELEVGQKAEGWRTTIRANKEAGLWHGVVPLGYRRPTHEEAREIGRTAGVIIPAEEQAELVRSLFSRAARGESIEALGRELVDAGTFRRQMTIYELLRNRVFLGELSMPAGKRVRARKLDGTVKVDNHGRPRYRYEGRVWTEGRHEAIVDNETFTAVERRLAVNPRSRARQSRSLWWGSGRVRCAGCGYVLKRDKKASGIYFSCQSRRRGIDCAGVASPRLDVVEATMLMALREALSGMVLPGTTDSPDRGATAAPTVEAAEERLGRGIAEALRLGLSERERDALLGQLREHVDAAKEAAATIARKPTFTDDALRAVERTAIELVDCWSDLSDEARRDALAALDVQVRVGRGATVELEAPWHAAARRDNNPPGVP